MNKNPLVSVLIPSYNHSEYIEEAIKSVWFQTYANIELIVVDDGSTDASNSLINELCAVSPIKMTAISKQNEGICKTLNRAIELSTGKYISILASDDRYLPQKLEHLIPLLEASDPSVAFVYSSNTLIANETKSIPDLPELPPLSSARQHQPGDLFDDILLFRTTPTICSMVFNKQILVKEGMFNQKYRFEDYDLLLRLSRSYKSIFIDVPTFEYRGYAAGSLGKSISLLYPDLIDIFEQNLPFSQSYLNRKWRAHARSSLYNRIAESFYMNLQTTDALTWSLRSIRLSPCQYKAYRIMAGSLLGPHFIKHLRRTKSFTYSLIGRLSCLVG